MRNIILILFGIIVSPLLVIGQSGSIKGQITHISSKTPVARASVFLSNSSIGTISSDNGNYTLNNIRPGQYTLVVTAIGYEDYTKTIIVDHEEINVDIELKTKSIQLREVVISTATKADWRRNYERFKEEFIGSDKNAHDCEVINPDVLNFTTHKSKKILEAYADEFLIVENRALGYRVKFLVKDFNSDYLTGIISYTGQRLFEELPGSKSQRKKWQIKRDEAYYGSAMHFYRSLYKNKLDDEGFEMYPFKRLKNPNRPPDEVIQKHIDKLRAETNSRSFNVNIDTVRYWNDMQNMSRYYMQDLSSVKYIPQEVLKTTETPGIYALAFPDCLYVIYKNKREETYFKDVYRPLNMPNYETTILSFLGKQPVVFFDMNGITLGESPLYEGTWSKSRLSTLLPVDYVPTAEQAELSITGQ